MTAAGGAESGAPADDRERPLLRFEHVTKRFGAVVAVDRLTLDIRRDELFALLGPSGCGKSTLLRLAAGFDAPDEGRILLEGEDLAGRPPHLRPVNMMFQSYALFPHLDVGDNIGFGLKQEALPRAEMAARVADVMALLRLEGLHRRRPDQLSGGQRQRVALARALVKRPKVLLLDEPLGALDKKLRDEMQIELSALRRRLGTTFVMVTHDQQEAMSLADRLAVMQQGRIAQVGSPAVVYETPATRYVAGFMGDVNLLDGTIARRDNDGVEIDCGGAGLVRAASAGTHAVGASVTIALRPERLTIAREPPQDATPNALSGVVAAVSYFGALLHYTVRIADHVTLKAAFPNRDSGNGPAVGERVWVTWPASAAVVLEQ